MNTYIIREFDSGDISAINKLFNTVFSLNRTIEEWNSKFLNYPSCPELKSLIVVAYYKKLLVGTFASVPYSISYKGKSFSALQGLDNCIHEEHRGAGIQSEMYALLNSLASRESYYFNFGFPGGKGRELGLRRLGYKVISELEKWVVSINSVEQQVNFSLDFREVSLPHLLPHVPISRREERFHVPKTFAYLKWRYAWKNDITFRIFASFKNDILQSYIVYGYRNIYPDAVNIYEIEYVNKNCALETLQRSFVQLKKDGVKNVAGFVKKDDIEESFLKLSGFTYCPDKYITVVIGKIWQSEVSEETILDPENWYVSLGDSDL